MLLYLLITLLGLALVQRVRNRKARCEFRRPPSPRSLPFIGNLLSVPAGAEYKAYMQLGKQLNSDIIFMNMLGQKILVLNSTQAAADLLEKRSAIYSDRFCPPMIGDPTLLDWSRAPTMVGYNDLWRHHRRMMNNWLNKRAVAQFYPLQERQARLLLKRLVDLSGEPQPFTYVREAIFFNMASSMLQLAYGYHPKNSHDSFFKSALEATTNTAIAGMPTNFLVNVFPALTNVPDWFPGTNWKRVARVWREVKEQAVNRPYEWTKAQVDAGVFEPSILSALLQEHNLTSGLTIEERDSRLKELAIMLYAGGTDTSSHTLVSFVAAMVLNPHVQDKAQQEIDETLGPAKLPTISDRDRLPYINRLISEVLRWRPVLPIGLPHVCFQDDIYRGYQVQKGTIVIGNTWAMSRDELVYKDAEVFDPDRYLDPNVPVAPAFGWGRRKCPGAYFAEASLFLAVASMLATFRFSLKKDAYGKDIIPPLQDAPNSLFLELEPFEFECQPRSESHRQMILETV